MSRGGGRPRTLLVGPVGQRPWITRNELVAQLDDLGHDVFVNGVGGPELVPPLEPLPSRVGLVRNSLPAMAVWAARMLWQWRRETRARLDEAGIDNVVVWDPVHAGLCRLARPKNTEVVWVPSRAESSRVYESIARAGLSMSADRVVVSSLREARWVRGRVTVAPLPRPDPSGRPLLDQWVVLGSATSPDEDAFARLAADAAADPAAAVVFDSRSHDRVAPALAERLRVASGAPRVWWTAGDEWLTWLGGVPECAVDPSRRVAVDHRHVRVLSEGGSLRVRPTAITAAAADVVTEAKSVGGWAEYRLRDDFIRVVSEDGWADAAFGDEAVVQARHIGACAVAVIECPLCGSADRRLAGRSDADTSVWQCRSCGLRHASYVWGRAREGRHGEVVAADERKLMLLDELGIGTGRLLRVGVETSMFTARAVERGWDATEVTIAGLEQHLVDGERVDVVVFDRSLETAADPVGLLRRVRNSLVERNGRVVIETPNARSASRYLQRRQWAQWRAGEGVSYADPWTVRQMLQRSGFQTEVLCTDSYPDAAVDGAALARAVGFVSEHASRAWPPVADAFDRGSLDGAVRRAARWVDRRGFGVHVLAVGRAI